MSRMALAATSLVAAIPAGILAVLSVMALLSSAGEMGPMLLAVVGGATLMGGLLALSPVVILVGKGQTRAKAAAKKGKDAKEGEPAAAVSGAQTAEIVADDLADEVADADEDAEAMSSGMSGSTGEFQFEDDAFADEELPEPEPEPEPKKKKKKKR